MDIRPHFSRRTDQTGQNAGRYRKLNLRSLTGLKEYKFKDKENVLLSHIHSLENGKVKIRRNR